ncbi:uncharacterized protein METZ01_LOCUS55182 [marine metagenome]|uniref:Uncharacterized protein n=1 Tax=marine metagenome TaxID=408172 RepID=A0A381SGB7_9ZZZZ
MYLIIFIRYNPSGGDYVPMPNSDINSCQTYSDMLAVTLENT